MDFSIYNSWSLWIMDQVHVGMSISMPPMVLTVCRKPVLKHCKDSIIFFAQILGKSAQSALLNTGLHQSLGLTARPKV